MNKSQKVSLIAALLCPCGLVCAATEPLNDRAILNAMESEIKRSMDTLSGEAEPVFFLSYEITRQQSKRANAAFGKLTSARENISATLDIDLRVGTPEMDNSRELQRGRSNPFTLASSAISLNNEDALQVQLWHATDRAYKAATEQLTKIKSDVQMHVQDENQAPDFAFASRVSSTEKSRSLTWNMDAWKDKVTSYSRVFADQKDFLGGSASAQGATRTVYYVNSEGSRLKTSDEKYQLYLSVNNKHEDGSNLSRVKSYFSHTANGMPDDETVLADAQQLEDELLALNAAPEVELYTGPAILTGRASGVFFHEILGHRLEGHRLKSVTDSQTFKEKIGERLLPANFSVTFDPSLTQYGKTDLVGNYRFDNEGVEGSKVTVVEDGILKGFLMSRTPIESFLTSNGHGRKSIGRKSVSRQSNLIVSVENGVSLAELKQALLDRVTSDGRYDYGLIFDDITGGFTFTGRSIPNAFNVTPVMVYKLYLDGTEELVRGVDLIGTPLTVFSKVVNGSDQASIFNGFCGAESGSVPVSAVSPAILISEVEVQKKQKSVTTLPILPPPGGDATGGAQL